IIPFRLITLSISAILLNDKYVKSRLIIEGSATLINVIMNFTLIPIWGVNGAILSVIVTEFIIAIYFEKTVVKKLGVKISKILYAGLIPIYIIMYVDINVYIKTFFSILLLLIAFKMIVVRVKILWEK
ncbi:polysaccharide biosynthesis C-terminal domain-containing protein, partial [Staphylococcus equorum]